MKNKELFLFITVNNGLIFFQDKKKKKESGDTSKAKKGKDVKDKDKDKGKFKCIRTTFKPSLT